MGRAVETVLRSRAFFAPANIGSTVIGPAEFVIGAVHALVPPDATPSTLILAEWIGRIGQELFEPPNVGGWPGGRAWLSPRSVVARTKFAAALIGGRKVGLAGPLDAGSIAAEQGLDRSATSLRKAASALLLGASLADGGDHSANDDTPDAARRALIAVLASPEAQLG
jgi:uncharacterized protein (DUF1800 family)